MAEMETYHTQKIEDFSAMTTEHLDGEIAFYEQVLHTAFLNLLFKTKNRYSYACKLRAEILINQHLTIWLNLHDKRLSMNETWKTPN